MAQWRDNRMLKRKVCFKCFDITNTKIEQPLPPEKIQEIKRLWDEEGICDCPYRELEAEGFGRLIDLPVPRYCIFPSDH